MKTANEKLDISSVIVLKGKEEDKNFERNTDEKDAGKNIKVIVQSDDKSGMKIVKKDIQGKKWGEDYNEIEVIVEEKGQKEKANKDKVFGLG